MRRIEGAEPVPAPIGPEKSKETKKTVSKESILRLQKEASATPKLQAANLAKAVFDHQSGVRQVDALIQHCKLYAEDPQAFYKMLWNEIGRDKGAEVALQAMLQVAGKGGTIAQFEKATQEGDFEKIAEMMPSPTHVAHFLEKLKDPAVFREFQLFLKGGQHAINQ